MIKLQEAAMNSKVLISLTFLCFILISCDSGMKWNNPLDPESKTYQACEESEEGKSRCFNAYSIQICKDGVWQYPQNCQKYEYCDEGKGECRAKDACTENPCAKILHSDGACKTTEDGFECGCEGNYSWKEGLCVKNTSELCNLCGDIEHATGLCPTDEDGNYFCECETNYGWDSQNRKCIGDTLTSECTGLPKRAHWNTVSEITQTWNGEAWEPSRKGEYNETPSETECRFVCNDTFHLEISECVADTKTNVYCEGLPYNASWNTTGIITQTWNGSTYEPSSEGKYNEEPSSEECRFKCNTNYKWNSSDSTCDAETRQAECTGLVQNASWYNGDSIIQTWNGSEWEPSAEGLFRAKETEGCFFHCNENYIWNPDTGGTCEPETQMGHCSSKVDHSVWNDNDQNGYFKQTWSGSEWLPESYTATYDDINPGTCKFKCADDYSWDGSKCHPECSSGIAYPCIVSESGLLWSDSTNDIHTWQEADDYCENLTKDGYSDWRLPTIDEIRFMIRNCENTELGGACLVSDPDCLGTECWSEELCTCEYDETINHSKFHYEFSLSFWSSSVKSDDPDRVWIVRFHGYAKVYTIAKTTQIGVVCVRKNEE